jgi:hypothetical protein
LIVKQEIAKQGILPSSLFFAQSFHMSIRSLFSRSPRTTANSETTPVPALMLHWFFTMFLIVAAVIGIHNANPSLSGDKVSADAYYFVVSMYAYVLDVMVYAWVGLGVLYLRLSPARRWAQISKENHWLSILCALIFSAGTVFPLICLWIPDPQKPMLAVSSTIPWFASQTVAFAVVGFSMLYWVGFRYGIPKLYPGLHFMYDQKPILHEESDGSLVQVAEVVTAPWGYPDSSVNDVKLIEREEGIQRNPNFPVGDVRLRQREDAYGGGR